MFEKKTKQNETKNKQTNPKNSWIDRNEYTLIDRYELTDKKFTCYIELFRQNK